MYERMAGSMISLKMLLLKLPSTLNARQTNIERYTFPLVELRGYRRFQLRIRITLQNDRTLHINTANNGNAAKVKELTLALDFRQTI